MASGEANPALNPDLSAPDQPGLELAQFAAGCFWGVELAFQRVEGVVKTEVGYSQGHVHNPNYKMVCTGSTGHAEAIRVHFDPAVCPYTNLLSLFWSRHDPTTLNRQVRIYTHHYIVFFLILFCYFNFSQNNSNLMVACSVLVFSLKEMKGLIGNKVMKLELTDCVCVCVCVRLTVEHVI